MRLFRRPLRATRGVVRAAALSALTVAASSVLAVQLPVASADPANPTDQQISQAEAEAAANAAELGRLNGVLAAIDGQIARQEAEAQAALDRYEKATNDVLAAVAAVDQAKLELEAAKQLEIAERDKGRQLAVEAYMTVSPFTASSMLLASDPTRAVESADLRQFLATRQAADVQVVTVAVVGSSNAEADLRRAQEVAEKLQVEADAQKEVAIATLRSTQSQRVALDAQRVQVNEQAALAAGKVAGLKDQRAAYEAWAAEQARLAELERQRQAAIAAERQRQAEAAAAAEAQRRAEEEARRRQQAANSGTSYTPPPPVYTPPSTPSYSSGGDGAEWVLPMDPSDYYVSSRYAARWGTFHDGTDLAAPFGSPIYAIGGGTVINAGPASGYGNWVVIDHGNGYVSIYGHMRVLAVSRGQTVSPGQLIAYVASEGQSTGPHLHLTIKRGGVNGSSVDPEVYLATRGVFL